MLELQTPYDVTYPCYLISTTKSIEEVSISEILLNGMSLKASKLSESESPLTGLLIPSIEDLFRLQTKKGRYNFVIDINKGRFYKCSKAIKFSKEYRLIEKATSDAVKVAGISYLISHNNNATLKEEGINRVKLVAELAVWTGLYYFLGVKNNEHRTATRHI